MFNRFRRKENQPQNVQVLADPDPVEKQQGFICPMCMASLPGPAELQAHFEKVHDESNGAGSDPSADSMDGTDALPENNEQLLSNISKGSLEIDLDSNAPDSEKVIMLLQQELSDVSVELKEERWYSVQLKTELEKVSAERDRLEEEKQLVEKEYMSQLRSAEEGYFEVVEENTKLKEDLVFADYNTTKERHEKLRQQTKTFQNEAEEEKLCRAMLEEDNKMLKEKLLAMQNELAEPPQVTSLKEENKTLKEQVVAYESEIEEERLRREGLETGINMLKQEVTVHKIEASEQKEKMEVVENQITELKEQITTCENATSQEKQRREAVEHEFMELKEENEKVETELHRARALLEEEIEKYASQTENMNGLQMDLNREKERISEMEKDHAEQLNKMERGDQGAVIQELSLEKAKLFESIASMESSMALKLKEQSGDIVNIRQEKMEVMVELRESQLERGKLKEELQNSNEARQQVMNELAAGQQENENLSIKLKKEHNEKENIQLLLEESEKGKEKLKEELAEGNDEKEIIMNELRKYQEEVKRVDRLLLEHQEEINVCKTEISSLNVKIKDYETSNANLNGLVIQKDETINEMMAIHSESIASLKSQMGEESQRYLNEIDAGTKESKKLTEELEKNREDLDLSKAEVTELNSKIVEYEARNSALESSLEQKEDILLDVHSRLEVAEQELQRPCDSCKNYEVRLCRLQEETKDSQGVIQTLKKEFEDFCSEVEEEKRALNSTISQLEEDKSTSEETANTSLLKISDLEIAIEGLHSEKELFIESALQAEERINTLYEEKTNLKKELSHLKVELLSQSAEKEEVAKELERKEGIWIDERNLLLQEAEDLKVNLLQEGEAHQKTKDTYQNKEGTYQQAEDTLHAEIANLQSKLEASEVECQSVIRSKEDLQNNLKKIEHGLTNRTKEISEYEKKMKSLERENNELKGDVNVLEVQLQSANEEKAALLERVLSTEEQHKKTKQRLSEANRKLDQSLSALQELGQENQNMQVQQVLKSSRQWLLDNECESCKKCDKAFSFTVRKHHCRHCGYIFCSECSCYSATTAASKKAVRVCESCSMELSSLRGSNVRRLSNASTASSVSTR